MYFQLLYSITKKLYTTNIKIKQKQHRLKAPRWWMVKSEHFSTCIMVHTTQITQ